MHILWGVVSITELVQERSRKYVPAKFEKCWKKYFKESSRWQSFLDGRSEDVISLARVPLCDDGSLWIFQPGSDELHDEITLPIEN